MGVSDGSKLMIIPGSVYGAFVVGAIIAIGFLNAFGLAAILK